jgi:hypothetical protein
MPEAAIRFIIGFIALLAGWAIGFFDSKIRADKKITQAEERAQVAVQQARGEAERAARLAQTERAATEAAKPALPGTSILRLWLDSSQRPMLDIDGQQVATTPISELNRKRLINLLSLMRPWIEGKAAAPVAVPLPTPAPVSPAPVSSAPSAPMPQPAPRPVTPAVVAAKPVLASKESKPAAPLSIVGQIDEILQAQLALTTLASRAIRLQESPEGGVIVWVGLQKYAGVDEVTDLEVKAVIRAAITEWEKRYTPGR